MKEKIIAKRYADALMTCAFDVKEKESVISDFAALKVIALGSPEFGKFLEDPEITDAEKNGFIDRVMAPHFSPWTVNFMKLLVGRRRTGQLGEIIDYIRINYSHGESPEVVLKMAYPQDDGTISAIKDKLEKKLGKRIALYLEIDGSLLGGVEAVIGNKVIDGSVRKRLDDLRESLEAAKVF